MDKGDPVQVAEFAFSKIRVLDVGFPAAVHERAR